MGGGWLRHASMHADHECSPLCAHPHSAQLTLHLMPLAAAAAASSSCQQQLPAASSSCAGAPAVATAVAARVVRACAVGGGQPSLRRLEACIQWRSGSRHPAAHGRGPSGAEQACTSRWQGGSQRRTGLGRSPGRPCAVVPPTAARTAGLALSCNDITVTTRAAAISAFCMHGWPARGGQLSGWRRQQV